MTLHVHTARLWYRGPDRFDITRAEVDRALKAGEPAPGEPWAPSWAILKPVLESRAAAKRIRDEGKRNGEIANRRLRPDLAKSLSYNAGDRAADIERAAWSCYVPAFIEEMRRSYAQHRAVWVELLARERVVLVCYCPVAAFCHRAILRTNILPKLGAVDAGELPM